MISDASRTSSEAGSRSVPQQKRNGKKERVEGIEPSSEAWEAPALPLSYTRIVD
jgi:hypothetical protein